jgi:hypothetical protein
LKGYNLKNYVIRCSHIRQATEESVEVNGIVPVTTEETSLETLVEG